MKSLVIFLVSALVVAGVLFGIRTDCKRCEGKGILGEKSVHTPCKYCAGTGKKKPAFRRPGSVKRLGEGAVKCPSCAGRGYHVQVAREQAVCPHCAGSGDVTLFDRLVGN